MIFHLISYRWTVRAVSSHHTFRSEMSYLNRKSSSICHPWCHRLSASKSASTCSDPPSISPVPNFLPQLFRHPDSSPNLNYVNADSHTDSCKLLSSRALSLPACLRPARVRAQRRRVLCRPSVFGGNLEVLLNGTELPHVPSHVSTVTLCDHAWLEPQSHQPVRRDTPPLPINPPPPKNTLYVPQDVQFPRSLK